MGFPRLNSPGTPLYLDLQLTASRRDVLTAADPYARREAAATQDRGEALYPLVARASETTGAAIDRDEVHVEERQRHRAVTLHALDELSRLRGRVVDAGEEHVLEGQTALRRAHVAARSLEHGIEIPLAIDRHDRAAHGVVRRVQAHGEAERDALLDLLVDLRDEGPRR